MPMFNEGDKLTFYDVAQVIKNNAEDIMQLVTNKDINAKNGRCELITKWRRVEDALTCITMGFGEYPYNGMLIKD